VLQNFDNTTEALDVWAGIISTLQVNREPMRRACTEHWALATDIAGAIVRETQLPWRTAHQITAILVRTALEQNKKPADIDSKFLDMAAREYIGEPLNVRDRALREVLDPLRAVKARTLFGGTAPDEVKRQIMKSRTVLAQERQALSDRRSQLGQAAAKLEAAIDQLLAGK
jgi:argininosuccinate lyase